MNQSVPTSPPVTELPVPSVVILRANNLTCLQGTGEVISAPITHMVRDLKAQGGHFLCCYAPRLKARDVNVPLLDILELFAFVHPACFCVPTVAGVARTLGLPVPSDEEEEAMSLLEAMDTLLYELAQDRYAKTEDLLLIVKMMGRNGKGWGWTPYIYQALGQVYDPQDPIEHKRGLQLWRNLPEWSEEAPPPPESHHGISGEEAVEQLDKLLQSKRTRHVEARPVQKDYAQHVAQVFDPVSDENQTHVLLAEAGTGVGKTLGYLAPASAWAEKNQGSVWLSTYTKNLQRQIDQELERLYPNPQVRQAKAAIRKGRENYLCLLNMEEMVAGAGTAYDVDQSIAAGLMLRWMVATRDGDLSGADFPGWLASILGIKNSGSLSDRRGECIYAACDHYHRCFVEKSIRKSEHARIVVANHALVMMQTALAQVGERLPSRYVFDEGHHVYDAADGAFSVHFTAVECKELRRWILGPEGGKSNRMRGLHKRIEDLVEGDSHARTALDTLQHHARSLPAAGWTKRLVNDDPSGEFERFFKAAMTQVYARSSDKESPYSLEIELMPVTEDVKNTAVECLELLRGLQRPMIRLAQSLRKRLEDDTEGMLGADERRRLDSVAASLERRAYNLLASWVALLSALVEGEKTTDFAEWIEVTKIEGRAIDIGLHRHWLDPMVPFAAALKPHAQGVVVTSATLRDPTEEDSDGWAHAKSRAGAPYLSNDVMTFQASSPFAYPDCSKVFVINDIPKNDMAQVATAYSALFQASHGSALGLFTAIQRLYAVHQRISQPLVDAGYPLYAQHIDDIDVGTLVDIFRDEMDSCLLGTDAIRDGVDIPGESLRLIVFDRVPWPRPTILHKARRNLYGRKEYDDMITAQKLRQAFGRLIRTSQDKGVFVMLDPMLPSRLYAAFPENVEIVKCSLQEAVDQIKDFFS